VTLTSTETRPASSSVLRRGRDLIEPDLFERLTARVAYDQQLDLPLAAQICDQAIAFLQACADNPHRRLVPSATVDIGWHAFILYTHEYAEFCNRVAGCYIHHVPTDGTESGAGADIADSLAAIEASGLAVDRALWPRCDQNCNRCRKCQKCKNCHQCHGGCHNSP
jgi:hypothetical protein